MKIEIKTAGGAKVVFEAVSGGDVVMDIFQTDDSKQSFILGKKDLKTTLRVLTW